MVSEERRPAMWRPWQRGGNCSFYGNFLVLSSSVNGQRFECHISTNKRCTCTCMSLTTLTRLDFIRPGFDVDLFRFGKGITVQQTLDGLFSDKTKLIILGIGILTLTQIGPSKIMYLHRKLLFSKLFISTNIHVKFKICCAELASYRKWQMFFSTNSSKNNRISTTACFSVVKYRWNVKKPERHF